MMMCLHCESALQVTEADILTHPRRSVLTLSCILVWEPEGAMRPCSASTGANGEGQGAGRGRPGSGADTPEAASYFPREGFAQVGGRRRQEVVRGADVIDTAF